MNELFSKARPIKLLALDVDGVLTNGSITYTDDGHELKTFNTFDGFGIRLLISSGIQVALITGRTSSMVTHRAAELGIQHVYQGVRDKLAIFQKLLQELNLSLEQAAYIGDDFPDLPIIKIVGLSISVPNAHEQLQKAAMMTTRCPGGEGAVREVCELIMNSQETIEKAILKYTHMTCL